MKINIFKEGKKNYSLFDAGLGEFVYLVLQYLIIAMLYLCISIGLPRGSAVNEVASLLVELGFVGTVLIVSASSKTSVFYATKINKKPTGEQIGFTILIAAIAYFGFSSLTNTFVDFLDFVGYKSASAGIEVNVWWKYLLYTVTMAAVPAFCEELLFRGVIYQGLRSWSKVGAIFISATLFMLMHGSPDQTVHQFLLGIVLALVFNATGSIWCPMLLHFLNNFVALTFSFILSSVNTNTVEATQQATQTYNLNPWAVLFYELISALVTTVFAFFLIWLIIKHLKKKRIVQNGVDEVSVSVSENGEKIIDIPSSENGMSPEISDKSKKIALVFFILSGIWVIFEWFQTLISGLM